MTTSRGSRLVLAMSMSLDGFISRPDGVLDWFQKPGDETYRTDDRRHLGVLELLGQCSTIIVGRITYEDMIKAWPTSDDPMAKPMNALPKIVFSSTLTHATWNNARICSDPLVPTVRELKAQQGGDMVAFGGATFGRALIAEGLVDEYRIAVHPVALGAGRSIWHGLREPVRLRTVETRSYADGTATHISVPA